MGCINSSKVYCKWLFPEIREGWKVVLIVAKCIVNVLSVAAVVGFTKVLIVAKCIVNFTKEVYLIKYGNVLIVAKCIVNTINLK